MLVKMLEHILGTRDGKAWPPRGGIADLPDDEALALMAHGYAQSVPRSGINAEAPTQPQVERSDDESREIATLPKARPGKPRRAK